MTADPPLPPLSARFFRNLQSGLLFVAVLVGIVAGRNLYEQVRTLQWHAVDGTVRNPRIAEDTLGVQIGKYPNHAVTTDGLHLEYSYTVAGTDYKGTRIRLRSSSRQSARIDSVRFPEGARVTVYYDPSNPALSILERQIGWLTVSGMIVAFGLLAAAAVAARHARARTPRAGDA